MDQVLRWREMGRQNAEAGTRQRAERAHRILVASEYATLEFLSNTKVRAPHGFGYGLQSDPENRVGVSYIFIELLPGEPYSPASATPEQKYRCFEQLSDILIKIPKHPASKFGVIRGLVPRGLPI
jgi:hypothetical protein